MFGRDIEDIKILKSRNEKYRSEKKNTMSGNNRRFDMAEEKISRHKDRAINTY